MRYVSSWLKSCAFVACLLFSTGSLAKGFPVFPTYRVWDPAVAGDFNGDGRVDLLGFTCATDACSTGTIAVALSNKSHGFNAPIFSGTTNVLGYGHAVVGDFNGDHKLDIAFPSHAIGGSGYFISIALGNGDGTFGPVANLASTAQILAVGDVNGDGKLDLVAVGSTTQVYLGNGDGTFQALAPSVSGSGCELADLNGDGKLDLVGNAIFLGNGDGTFQPSIPLPFPVDCPAIADFNGDGKLDIAGGSSNGVEVSFGNGDGTFQPGVNYKGGLGGEAEVADFNGDGVPDLFVNGAVFLNTGHGAFRFSAMYGFPNFSLLADVNQDGRSDVIFGGVQRAKIVSGTAQAPFISVGFAQPDGTFLAPHVYSSSLDVSQPSSITLADFNDDGKIDLGLCGTLQSHVVGEFVRFYGKGNGTFSNPVNGLTGDKGGCNYIAAADLNNDGKVDVVLASDNMVNVRLGLGGNKLGPPVRYSAPQVSTLAIADLNGDGIPDIVASGNPGEVLLGNGDGTFRTGTTLPDGIEKVLIGDFNNDGRPDLAILSGNGIAIMLGKGDGTFQAAFTRPSQGTLLMADFNNDGKLDLAQISPVSGGVRAMVSVFLGRGDGTLMPALNTSIDLGVEESSYSAVTADFNGDGNADLAVSVSSGGVGILLGKGDGHFANPSFYVTQGSFGPHALLAADVDGNGTQDLVFYEPIDNMITVLLNEPLAEIGTDHRDIKSLCNHRQSSPRRQREVESETPPRARFANRAEDPEPWEPGLRQ